MPYIHLETTSDVVENGQIPEILEVLASELASMEDMDGKAIKAYHSIRPNWFVAGPVGGGFARCTVALLSGRSESQRKAISDQLYARLRELFHESLAEENMSAHPIHLTLEIREMDAATYKK